MNTKNTQQIRNFWVAGIDHKAADTSIRGQYSVNNEQYDKLLAAAPQYGLNELFVLSTCNRTEIYGFADDPGRLAGLLCSVCSGDAGAFIQFACIKNANAAIEHLFHVAAGLDSQILGDFEILGQVKNAAKKAKAQGLIGPFMERLLNSVLQAAKAIKTHTALSGGTVSASFAAVQYIREYFDGPSVTPEMRCPATAHMLVKPAGHISARPAGAENINILLLGTGKIGRTTCKNLIDYLGTRNITLMNRTEETARALANELKLKHAPIEDMDARLRDADVILVSTSAAEPVVLKHHLDGAGEKLVIDFSVPCNVAKEARQLANVKFVNVDMLSKIKDETLAQRKAEVPKAVAIINEMISEFDEWYIMRRHVPVLKEVKNKLKDIYIEPALLENNTYSPDAILAKDEKIQKVINSLAVKIRRNNTLGCHYIQAINEYIA